MKGELGCVAVLDFCVLVMSLSALLPAAVKLDNPCSSPQSQLPRSADGSRVVLPGLEV